MGTIKKGNEYFTTVTRYLSVWDFEGPVSGVIEHLQAEADDLIDPTLDWDIGYDSDIDVKLNGLRPATEKEIERHKKKAKTDRERAKKQKEERAKKKAATEAKALESAVTLLRKERPELLKDD